MINFYPYCQLVVMCMCAIIFVQHTFLYVYAEETVNGATATPIILATEPTEPLGNASCFDFYEFNSIQVDVAPPDYDFFPGQIVPFVGTIHNNNTYPVVDGQVWMKVFFLEQNSDEEIQENGYPLVDFVLVEDGVTLTAQGSRDIDFSWNIPEMAQKGKYMVAFFFTTAHRYNLLGLSFTDDVTGNTTTFEVKKTDVHSTTVPVTFDKNTVRLNQTDVSFALPARHFLPNEEVVAFAKLVNDNNDDHAVTVTWKTYQWDGILEVFKRDVHTETITVPPKSSTAVSYLVPTIQTAVTYVLAEVKDGDSRSLLNIRFVRDDIPETRINFPSVTTYPLKAGEEVSLFSCVHSTNFPLVPDNTLTLSLKDGQGNVLRSYTYKGGITGAMMGIADTYVPTEDISTFSLTASLSRGNIIVEEITVPYRCEDIDPTFCDGVQYESVEYISKSQWIWYLLYLIGGTALLYVIFSFIRKTLSQKVTAVEMHMPDKE